ncbi:MAG: nucleotide sugar dehydrogenase, partial [Armatimonadota bacterium]
NTRFGLRNTTRLVGGVTAQCCDLAALLYSQIVTEVVPVSSPRVAETAKLLENLFRHVNIALVNEMALLCDRMGLDVWEIIDAASTKPFGFMRFEPGPGVGGHCVPVDPCYLAWKARSYGFHTRFIELAGDVNTSMPRHVVQKVTEALNSRGKSVRGSRVLALGVAYKSDIGDTRESAALRILPLLHELGAEVSYNDPHVASFSANGLALRSEPLTDAMLEMADCVIILTKHSCYDFERIAGLAPLIVDTRNALREHPASHVFTLAAQPAGAHAAEPAAAREPAAEPWPEPLEDHPVLAADA